MINLKWTRKVFRLPDQIGYHAGPYAIYTGMSEGAALLTSGPPDYIGPFHTNTVQEAMDIAEAYAQGGPLD